MTALDNAWTVHRNSSDKHLSLFKTGELQYLVQRGKSGAVTADATNLAEGLLERGTERNRAILCSPNVR